MRFGPNCEDGFLPVHSVCCEERAKKLLTLACQTNAQGEYISEELAREQKVDNLFVFGDRLARVEEGHLKECSCGV